MTSRRSFLAAVGGTAAAGLLPPPRAQAQAPPPPSLPPVPRVNGGINIQPARLLDPAATPDTPGLDPAVVDALLATAYGLGFAQARIPISWNRFGHDFFASIPYVRACRALGLDVLCVLTQATGLDFAQALSQPGVRTPLLRAYLQIFASDVAPAPGVSSAGRVAFQILNEPVHSLGVAPNVYLRRLLAPTYLALKNEAPELAVVAAAEVGTPEGVLRVRTLLETGLEDLCDEVAYHVYDPRVIPLLAGLARKPVRVTETGADGPAQHRAWVEEVVPRIAREIAGVAEIDLYVLYDGAPGRYQLVDLARDPDGSVRVVAESDALLALYVERVAAATQGATTSAYRDLVPDVTVYFPTAADAEAAAAVPPLAFP
ncbi:MAG TPA: hypothetical protein VFM88_14575 [Vicinamibacteria bacterium]|nr:hypothetical protein [Vicinamibacteria bacterium]